MKPLIDLSREINSSAFENKAIVKSQKRNDPVIGGISRTGLYYEGYSLSPALAEYIGEYTVYFTCWKANERIKAFVSPR